MKNSDYPKKTIAILGGTGKEGKGLAFRLALSGYKIIIGSRSQKKAQATIDELNSKINGSDQLLWDTYEGAIKNSNIIFLVVPYAAHREILETNKDGFIGKLLIDVTVPLSKVIDMLKVPPAGSAAQEAQQILGKNTEICTAFQNISYTVFYSSLNCDCDVLVTGTSELAREQTLEIVARAGFKGWDAGTIENSIVVEGLTPILIHINKLHHSSHAGIKITGV